MGLQISKRYSYNFNSVSAIFDDILVTGELAVIFLADLSNIKRFIGLLKFQHGSQREILRCDNISRTANRAKQTKI